MVRLGKGWRVAAPAALFLAAASLCPAQAMDFGSRPVPPGEVPVGFASEAGSRPKLSWGGPVPKAPVPGEAAVYVPSPSLYAPPSRPTPQPVYEAEPQASLAPPADDPATPAQNDVFEAAPDLRPEPAAAPEPAPDAVYEAPEPRPEPLLAQPAASDLGIEDSEIELYVPTIAENPGDEDDAAPFVEEASLPPLAAPVEVDEGTDAFGYAAIPRQDPWAGLKQVTPGAIPVPKKKRKDRRQPSYASLERMVPPRRASDADALPGRGALEEESPSGYTPMPKSEMQCRRALQKLGVRFVDAASIHKSRSCGIDHPVKVSDIAPGIVVRPAATLNCAAALRVAQWMSEEVKPAARWKLLKRPTVLINASSYRCSRIAGSRSVSEHSSGNALDVRGFKFSDGSVMEIEKKGVFELRQKAFQKKVRESACRYFGTVLGPGYNEDHADHLHLDAKQRRRGVCK